jgi:hypothetical protein
MSCPHASDLAVFVLGVDGHHPLERHVAGCPTCQTELADLTAVTGLLAAVRQQGLEVAETTPTAFPDDLLDRVLAAIASERAAARRSRQRRRAAWFAAAAAAAVFGAAGGLVLAGGDHVVAPAVTASQFGVEATTSLHPDPSGTRVEMALTNLPPVASCRLVARARDGRTETVTWWRGGTYDTAVDVTATSSIRPADLAELQVIDDRGRRLLTVAARGHGPHGGSTPAEGNAR